MVGSWRQKALLEFCALLRLHNRPSVVQKSFAFEGYKETWDWLVGKYTLPRTRMARGIRGRRPTSQEVQLVPVPGSLPRTPPQAEQARQEAEEEGAPPPEEAEEERHEVHSKKRKVRCTASFPPRQAEQRSVLPPSFGGHLFAGWFGSEPGLGSCLLSSLVVLP